MARLPDSTVFGGIDSSGSGRQIATYDPSGYARGAAAEAAGFEKLGEGIQQAAKGVSIYAKQQQKEDDALEIARAKSEYLTKKVETDEVYKDDKEHESLVDRYGKDIDTVRANSAALIRNPRTRELFELSIADDVAKAKAAAGGRATSIWKDNTLADGNTRLEEIRNAALKTSDPVERDKLIQSGNDIITSLADKNIITRNQAVSTQKEWAVKYAAGAFAIMPAQQRLDELRVAPVGRDGVLDRIGKIENSSGDPAARSSTSSAMGDFQFINSTWLQTVKVNRPDLMQGRTEAQVLALRADPKLSREVAGYLLDANGAALQKSGVEATPSNLYLAHFLGPAGAAAVLKAKPGTPVSDILDAKAIEANSSVLAGKTTDTVINWASRKMGGGNKLASLLPEDTRVRLQHEAEREVAIGTAKRAADVAEMHERKIIDAQAGIAPLPPRETIENDPELTPTARNTLLRQHGAAIETDDAYKLGAAKIADPNAVWNPRLDADKKALEAIDTRMGVVSGIQAAEPQAASVAVHRFSETGMVSTGVKGSLEGMIRGGNDKQLEYAMSVLDGMSRKNPNAFAESFDKDTVKTLTAWQNKQDQAPGAFREMLKRVSSPAMVKAREEAEKEGRKIVEKLSDDDVMSALDKSWFSDPQKPMGTREAPGMKVYREQYAELYAEGYASSDGNPAAAKAYADKMITANWAVSESGGGRVMMHAPENMPNSIFPVVDGSRDWMKKQVQDTLRARITPAGEKKSSALRNALSGEADLPAYGLVALPGTLEEIQAVKAGRELPGGRKSPAWALVYVDPKTQILKQEMFYFDLDAVKGEMEKANAKNLVKDKAWKDNQSLRDALNAGPM